MYFTERGDLVQCFVAKILEKLEEEKRDEIRNNRTQLPPVGKNQKDKWHCSDPTLSTDTSVGAIAATVAIVGIVTAATAQEQGSYSPCMCS